MADSLADESPGKPINPQQEKLSDKAIPVNEQNTEIPKQATGNMEVHKHLHHVMHKKNMGEYLLEFIMLFLAVFLGFLAENKREHQVEKERGRQYIESFMRI